MINHIRKRDGQILSFNREKITHAIFKAAKEAGAESKDECGMLTEHVIEKLNRDVPAGSIPTVEGVQDIVEQVLIETGHAKTAKAYIIYRQKRAEIRAEKAHVLEKEEIDEVDKKFDVNALKVLKARYLRKDDNGKLVETPKQLFTRVAVHTTLPDLFYDPRVYAKDGKKQHNKEEFEPEMYDGELAIGKYVLNKYHLEAVKRVYDRFNRRGQMKVSWHEFLDMIKDGEFNEYERTVDEFFGIMVNKQFMPNTPAIANFGSVLGMGSACFVLGVDDDLASIMDSLKCTAFIHQAGGGTGFNFSKLRPEGDIVKSTSGTASGPLSFMTLYDNMTDVIKQGGMRRGANMGILNSNHPDIEKFIIAKEGNKALRNFNISVLIMGDFWEYYEKDEPYPLINPRNGQVMKTINPRMLFDKLVYQAWESAEPGVIFFDRINEFNPFLEHLGPIVTTNPCVSGDTLISTENGLERIDSMKTRAITVDARAENLQSNGTVTVKGGCLEAEALQVVKTGTKDVYNLTTRSGYELSATADHRILTDTGWKELKDITEKDSILIQSGAGRFNRNKNIPFHVENTITGENGRKYKLNLPTTWSKELGVTLGWLTGDGWLSEKYNSMGLVFAEEDESVRCIIQPIFENYCNRAIEKRVYENGCVQIRSASKYVVDFFKKLGVMDSKKDRCIPSAMFTATEDTVKGFLQGLFSADGTIGLGSKSRNYIRLNSSSERLLKEVQLMLLNMGIRSSIYDRSTDPKKFKYVNKKGELVIHKTSGKNYELNISKENVPRFLEKIGFVGDKFAPKLERLKSFEFYHEHFLDVVKSVEYVGKKEVWDITEPRTHSFIANGIVVHNCGEVLLYPNEPCNLGSVNVWAFAREDENGKIYLDWDGMSRVIRIAAHFLDNVIDVNKWPLQQIEDMALATRKIGLGVMGVGDLLFDMGIPYNREDGRVFMEKLMEFVNYWSKAESVEMAKSRGPLPFIKKSFYPDGRLPFRGSMQKQKWNFDWDALVEEVKTHGIRNGYTTIVAPTGSISMIAGCSSGIEPVYSLVFEKNVKVGSFYYIDPVFEKVMRREGLYDEDLMKQIAENRGSIQNVAYIPKKMKDVFVTAMDVNPENHIRALAAFQTWVDSSISKTNNFPANATVENMKESYLFAYQLGCKGVTVFRDSSIKDQVLVAPKAEKRVEDKKEKFVRFETPVVETSTAVGTVVQHKSKYEYTTCPNCNTSVSFKEGCVTCEACGWGVCS